VGKGDVTAQVNKGEAQSQTFWNNKKEKPSLPKFSEPSFSVAYLFSFGCFFVFPAQPLFSYSRQRWDRFVR